MVLVVLPISGKIAIGKRTVAQAFRRHEQKIKIISVSYVTQLLGVAQSIDVTMLPAYFVWAAFSDPYVILSGICERS